MKRFDIIPAMIFGAMLGAVIALSIRDAQRLPISLMPSLVTAMTTIAVGWWIHTAVRHRGELDRIPINYLSDLNQRISELITACFGATGEERVMNVRRLSIEISHLREITRRIQPELAGLEKELGAYYIDFKKYLTDSDAENRGAASKASSGIRMTALKIQWRLSKYFLEQQTDADILASD